MFIRFLFVCCICLLCQIKGFCQSDNILNELEYKKYGVTFQTESLAERLQRLETDSFGMVQQGNIEARLDKLYKMNNNIRSSAIQNPIYDDYPRKKRSAIRRFFDNLGNSGSLTGFTPSISNSSFNNGSYYESIGSGYNDSFPKGMFNNLLNNRILNNRNNYCPYHDNYHNHSYINNRYNKMHFGSNHNDNWHQHPHHNFSNHNQYMNPNYAAYSNVYKSFYVPPNVQSRTSVRIIRD